jgi:hypothetical protein
MPPRDPHLSIDHISDEELVRSADGELSPQRAREVGSHLEACWDCRARMEEIQAAITGFVRAHHAEFDPQLPPVAGPRALLRARLAELDSKLRTHWWQPAFQFGYPVPAVAIVCLVAMAIGSLGFGYYSGRNLTFTSVLLDSQTAPNRSLTPGATRPVTITEICSAPHEEVVEDVAVPLRQMVLHEYGISNARPEDYEIDYLIAPRLGGTEDIRNLWPEPYRTRVWNAHVKDALEERLHEMVCSGKLDLSTAQHDIATDWIAAYKKYFHTNKPLPRSL